MNSWGGGGGGGAEREGRVELSRGGGAAIPPSYGGMGEQYKLPHRSQRWKTLQKNTGPGSSSPYIYIVAIPRCADHDLNVCSTELTVHL